MSTAGWRLLQRLEVHNADLALAELPERTKANLGAREVGKFKVSLDLLYQAEDWMKGAENKESAAPRMFQLSFSEVPDKEYFMVGKRVVEATKEINTILSELKLTRRRVSMTVEGKLFVSGQFRIRLGQLIVQSKRTSTVVLEVQHLSSPSEESEPFIKELTTFIHGFLSADTINSVPVAFSNFSLPTTSFTPKHRALQYVHLVQQAMSSSKKSQAAAASSNSVGGASSAGHTSMPWSSTGSEEKKR